MQTEPQNEQKTTQQSRRQFLTRTTAGVVIAALPAKSVWATTGGIAQSIVASGHSSDFAGGKQVTFLSPGYWKTHLETVNHPCCFKTEFGGKAFSKMGNPTLHQDTTFGQILMTPGADFKGISTVNFHMVAMFLNAKYHGQFGLNFPIIGTGKPFPTLAAFADYLYKKASADPAGVGDELTALIKAYHVGGPSQYSA